MVKRAPNASVNLQGGLYGNPLQAASAAGHNNIVGLLLYKGSDINACAAPYETALWAASERLLSEGHQETVQLFLQRGANVDAQWGQGTALQAASIIGHVGSGELRREAQQEVMRVSIFVGGAQEEWPLDPNSSGGLYSDGLTQLATELDQKYELDNISSISYALAVDLNCLDPEQKSAGMTFYPLAFNMAVGNFTSPLPPRFLQDHVFAVMKDNMGFRTRCGRSVVRPPLGVHQHQTVDPVQSRGSPSDAGDRNGGADAAGVGGQGIVRAIQQRLLRRMEGSATPDDAEASRPFTRERQRIQHAVAESEFAFRIKQVISLDVARLTPSRRNLRTILRPIFQLMQSDI
ncbi:hypothetical protein O988_00562 [Pseudogymnoascus sp. VKM F-3808]|nr:hypothetical protein O988_00562 [Pseudogymnoascus sp. VKM F-3808]